MSLTGSGWSRGLRGSGAAGGRRPGGGGLLGGPRVRGPHHADRRRGPAAAPQGGW